MRSPGEDDAARKQGGAATEKFDERRNIKDHVGCVGMLDRLPVEDGFNGQDVRVANLVGSDQTRTERTERIKGFSPAPLAAALLFCRSR
jgi:hypothetical protein